jgi:hypothetical protein
MCRYKFIKQDKCNSKHNRFSLSHACNQLEERCSSDFFLSFFSRFYLLIAGVVGYCCNWSRSVTHSVGLLWTMDGTVAEASTSPYTIFTRDRHPCSRRDSNPQSHQASLFRFPTGSLFKTYSTAYIYFFHVFSTPRLTNSFEISTFPRTCLWKQTILLFAGPSSTWLLTFTFRPLNPNVAADGRTYFQVKCPYLYLSGTAFSFSPINC